MSESSQQSNPEYEIRLRDDGFSRLRKGQTEFDIVWDNVRGIAAFKQDIFVHDLICVAFRTDGSPYYCHVSEDDAGYEELVQEIERRFPDHNPEWWRKVAFPPCQYCWTVIWGDASRVITCPRCGQAVWDGPERRCSECGHTIPPDACVDCAGRGSWWWFGALKFASVVGGIGAILLATGFVVGFAPLAMLGILALLITALAAAISLLDLRVTCDRCDGSGKEPAEQVRPGRTPQD